MRSAEPTAGRPPLAIAAAGTAGAPVHKVAKAISAGTASTCALQDNGTVWCWGNNENGQLGDGTSTESSVPVQVLGIDSAVAIAAGGFSDPAGLLTYNCAVLRDGSVQCWGLVPGHDGKASVPVPIPGIQRAIAVAAGNIHACALSSIGSIQCWGGNTWGQLGDGIEKSSQQPVTVLGIDDAKSVVGLASDFSCAVLTAGSVVCWGAYFIDSNGRLDSSSRPVAIPSVETTPTGIAAGYDQACSISPDGHVQCWRSPYLRPPETLPHAAKAVAVGLNHACALLSDGTIQCWGINYYGETDENEIHDAIAVSAGPSYTCALLKTGSVWCWGSNASGQLGNGADGVDRMDRNGTPVEVRGF